MAIVDPETDALPSRPSAGEEIPMRYISISTLLLLALGSAGCDKVDRRKIEEGREWVEKATKQASEELEAAAYGVSTLIRLALGEDTGAIEEIAVGVLARGYLLKHSRDDEREADSRGMQYVLKAGHSPIGFVDFFERPADQPSPPALLSTHLDPAERAERA